LSAAPLKRLFEIATLLSLYLHSALN